MLVILSKEGRKRKAAGTGDHAILGTKKGAKKFITKW
jgi:hypothetical protein